MPVVEWVVLMAGGVGLVVLLAYWVTWLVDGVVLRSDAVAARPQLVRVEADEAESVPESVNQ